MQLELVKIICQSVAIRRDESGGIIDEVTSQPQAVYNPEQLVEYYEAAKREVDAANAAEKPNRAARRRKKPTSS